MDGNSYFFSPENMNGQTICDITTESFDLDGFSNILNRHLSGFGIEVHPFNVRHLLYSLDLSFRANGITSLEI